MKYYIKTFGCQMNWSDSERITGLLEKNNIRLASNINEADLVVFNTCGVRQMAEDRVYGQIHNLKTRNSQPVTIVLTGCLANRSDVIKRLKDKVDLFCEIKNFHKKFQNLNFKFQNNFQNSKFKIKNSSLDKEKISYLTIKPKYRTPYSAYIPIMTGCNNFCSYCVVPYARGREISRPAKEIIKEIKGLVKKGYKEIVLLGQNVNSYKNGKINFSKLLKKVNSISGNFWIHFISNHPKDVTDEMIETVAKCQKVCEIFHLPIQAGNNEIIRKMNRKYTQKQYLGLIKKIKAAYAKYKPEKLYSITSDIIVGFPSETKKQFLDSAKIIKKVGYDMVFFGQFSPRPGTAAWKMKDNVSKAEKVRREKYLNEILKKTSYANNKNYAGKTFDVLVENEKNGTYFGKTQTMKNVKIVANKKNLVGKIIKVSVIKANIWNLEASLDSRKRSSTRGGENYVKE